MSGVWRVDVNPLSPTYGQVESQAKWVGELMGADFTADGNHLVMSNAHAHQILDLCLGAVCIPMEARFTALPIKGKIPLGVQFFNTSRGVYSGQFWNFGDSNTSTLRDPFHTFTLPGAYTVTLNIIGPGGSDVKTIPNCITALTEIYLPVIIK